MQCMDVSSLKDRSQTTFARRGRQVVQKCQIFVNIYTIENVNTGGQVVKKAKTLSTQFVNDPLPSIQKYIYSREVCSLIILKDIIQNRIMGFFPMILKPQPIAYSFLKNLPKVKTKLIKNVNYPSESIFSCVYRR